MSAKLPRVPAKKIIAILEKKGFVGKAGVIKCIKIVPVSG